ncbi:unnamed protein product [Prunus armeniaca]
MAKHFPPNHKFVSRPSVKIRGMPPLKNKRKKKKVQKKAQIPQEDEYEQSARVPVTLIEFCQLSSSRVNPKLRKKLFNATWFLWRNMSLTQRLTRLTSAPVEASYLLIKHNKMRKLTPLRSLTRKRLRSPCQKKTVAGEVSPSSSKAKDPKFDTRKAKESSQSHALKYDILAHLKPIPTPLSVYDALKMSRELREALVMASMSPDSYKSYFKSADAHTTETSKFCASCMVAITFGEDDFLLGSKSHNRPLYVTGEVGGTTINRILLDCGSAVNLIPLKTLHAIGMSAQQLSPSMLTIQGFNQLGQKAMGSITLQMEIGDLYSDALFHVINADTSARMSVAPYIWCNPFYTSPVL